MSTEHSIGQSPSPLKRGGGEKREPPFRAALFYYAGRVGTKLANQGNISRKRPTHFFIPIAKMEVPDTVWGQNRCFVVRHGGDSQTG